MRKMYLIGHFHEINFIIFIVIMIFLNGSLRPQAIACRKDANGYAYLLPMGVFSSLYISRKLTKQICDIKRPVSKLPGETSGSHT